MNNPDIRSESKTEKNPAILFMAENLQLGAQYRPYAVFDVSKKGGQAISNRIVDILKAGGVDFRLVVNEMTVTVLTRKKVETGSPFQNLQSDFASRVADVF